MAVLGFLNKFAETDVGAAFGGPCDDAESKPP